MTYFYNIIKKAYLPAGRREEIIRNTEKEYRVYTIPKQNGGKRVICEPSEDLKKLQRSLIPYVKSKKVSKHATAYEKGASVKKNAEYHKKGQYILHTDISNFFPSINKKMVMGTYCSLKTIAAIDREKFWNLVSYKDGLPIGATTSPFIANRVVYKMDKELARLGGVFKKIKYTRYADDLVFSSKKPLEADLIKKVDEIVRKAGFSLNYKKTYFMHDRKEVTGIIITDEGKISVGTSYKKRLKSDIYDYLTKGKGDKRKIRGRFAHLKNIEPEYAQVIESKYKPIDKKGFFK